MLELCEVRKKRHSRTVLGIPIRNFVHSFVEAEEKRGWDSRHRRHHEPRTSPPAMAMMGGKGYARMTGRPRRW